MISVPYIVLPATSPVRRSDPIVYFAGGPGLSAVATIAKLATYSMLRRDRDIIAFTIRGAGYSDPELLCPAPVMRAVDAEAARACLSALSARGIDLRLYDSANAAADFSDLRRLLKLQQVNLVGLSYGTRLALTIVRDHPDAVRSLVLDGPVPLEADISSMAFANQLSAYDKLFDACAADPSCHRAFPELRQSFVNAITRLDSMTPSEPEGFGAANLADAVFDALYHSEIVPLLPAAIDAAARGDVKTFLALATPLPPHPLPAGIGLDRIWSDGVYFAYNCREDIPFAAALDPDAAGFRWPRTIPQVVSRSYRFERDVCSSWGISPGLPGEAHAVGSSIPTLILVGEFDPITPRAWAELLTRSLTHAHLVEAPAGGHGVLPMNCPQAIAAAFLDRPTIRPDTRCIRRMPKIRFETNAADAVARSMSVDIQ